MHLIFFIDKLARGGAPMHLRQLLPALQRKGYEPLLYCLKDEFKLSAEFEEYGVKVINLDIKRLLSIKTFFAIIKVIRQIRRFNRIEKDAGIEPSIVVFCYLFSATIFGYMLKKIYPFFKYVVAWRDTGYWLDDRRREWLVTACRKADALTANSDAVFNSASKITGAGCPAIYKIYNGVKLPEIDLQVNNYKETKKNKKLVLGMMARFCPEKGHDTMVKAVAELKKRREDLSVQLGGDGDTLESVKKMSEEYGVADMINFLGRVDSIDGFYRKIDVLLAPSRSEGFSNSILEAMAYGLPVIGTIAGGIPEAVVKDETGLLFNVDNYESLADKISLLNADRDYMLKLGGNGTKRVEENFSREKMAEATLAVCRDILGKGEGVD